MRRPLIVWARLVLQPDDVGGLQPLGARHDGELYAIALFQITEAATLNGGVVDKDVRAIFTGDEAIALGPVEPLHCAGYTFSHDAQFLSLLMLRLPEREAW